MVLKLAGLGTVTYVSARRDLRWTKLLWCRASKGTLDCFEPKTPSDEPSRVGGMISAQMRPNALAPFEADALVRRLASRDIEAFEVLYDANYRMVFAIGVRLVGDVESAEDLTQVVFLKVWANPASFKGGSFGAWIARVARNAGLDVLRQRAARGETEIAADVPLDEALEDTVLANLDAQRVRSALRRLPATERVPIEMGFFRGMTYRSVALETGVPLGTVKTRIRTGLHRLRDALDIRSDEAC